MSERHTVGEIARFKEKAEAMIWTEIFEFEQKTGLSVSHINLTKDLSDPNKTSVSAVKLAVIL